MLIYGINPVLEALRTGRVRSVRVSGRADQRVQEVLRLAAAHGAKVMRVDAADLDRAARGGVHQGVVAEVGEAPEYDVADLVRGAAGAPLIVVLDGVEDPHNFGAILRVADAAGVDGVVRQTRRSASVDGVAAKASAGAIAHVRMASVVNISRAVEELKGVNVWTVGLAGDADECYSDIDLTLPTALVFGAEGDGAAAAGSGNLRPDGPDPHGRPRLEPERERGGRHRAVRGRPAAGGGARETRMTRVQDPCSLARDVLH